MSRDGKQAGAVVTAGWGPVLYRMLLTEALNRYLPYCIREWKDEHFLPFLNYLLGNVLQSATSKCSLAGLGVLGKGGVHQEGMKLLAVVMAALPPA